MTDVDLSGVDFTEFDALIERRNACNADPRCTIAERDAIDDQSVALIKRWRTGTPAEQEAAKLAEVAILRAAEWHRRQDAVVGSRVFNA